MTPSTWGRPQRAKATPLAEVLGYAFTANSLALVATAGSGHRKRLETAPDS
jgi:hypothetical protein